MSIPELPMLPTDESMLSRKFGPEVANYFAGSPLNRVSFLRSDHDFMRSAFAHPSANILLLHNLGPLVQKDTSRLAYATRADVIGLTGPDPFEKKEEQQIKDFDSEVVQPVILFLGIDDKQRLPSNGSDGPGFEYKDYKGCPYFAIDVAPRGSVIEAAKALVAAMRAKGLSFNESPRNMSLSASEGEGQPRAPCRLVADHEREQPLCSGRRVRSSTGTRGTHSVLSAASRRCP